MHDRTRLFENNVFFSKTGENGPKCGLKVGFFELIRKCHSFFFYFVYNET